MNDPEDFTTNTRLADELIDKATKDQLADASRLLVLNIGFSHEKYGDVPQETLLRMVMSETLDKETERLLLHGMPNLVSARVEVIGVAKDGGDDDPH